ncbi:MAG: response regulator [Leptolyngbya sp.]|nr:response regulator [Candidatus Melainabacteria bacterium]
MPNKLKLILVVDDAAINLMGTSLTVRSLGYTVHEAVSGRDALVMLKERSYAAILMDVQMPEMSGIECTEKIRAIETGSHCRIPIIACSSMAESDAKQACFDAGMDAFLDKACSSDELAKILEQLVSGLPNLSGLTA